MTYGPAPSGGSHIDDAADPDHTGDRAGPREWQRRMQLERQLHDGASLRVSALSLRLGLLRRHSPDEAFQRAVSEVQDELHTVLDELRAVAGQIYPTLLDQAGLGPALRELADQAGLAVTVRAGEHRFGTAAEGAGYFAVADVLAVTGSSDPVEVVIEKVDQQLIISLIGVPACHAGLVTDRVEAMNGSVTAHAATTDTPVTAPTTDRAAIDRQPQDGTITVRIPCE
jgi:hypothetical protein